MSKKILGSADLAATTNTTIYTVPASKEAVFNVNICNRTTSAVTVRLAIADAATPTDAEWLEYGTTIEANGVLERTGFVAETTKLVVAYSSAADVSVVVYGMEEDV